MSALEALIGLALFVVMFTFTFRAFAPTATDSHNLLRGVTVAMNACNWYLNDLEREINYRGGLPDTMLGTNDVTYVFEALNADQDKQLFSDLPMLRSLRADSSIQRDGNLYKLSITLRWAAQENAQRRPHSYTLTRLKVRP